MKQKSNNIFPIICFLLACTGKSMVKQMCRYILRTKCFVLHPGPGPLFTALWKQPTHICIQDNARPHDGLSKPHTCMLSKPENLSAVGFENCTGGRMCKLVDKAAKCNQERRQNMHKDREASQHRRRSLGQTTILAGTHSCNADFKPLANVQQLQA